MKYINVMYNEKDLAKNLGAKFDFNNKLWYIPQDINELNEKKILKKWELIKQVALTGEDRNYGGNDLFVDLIPKSCWFKNVRTSVARKDWDILRKHIYSRVNYICECCGIDTKNNKIQLEAHERWHYNKTDKIQKLVRLIALCKNCHISTHIGFADICGVYNKAFNHLKKVRNDNSEDCNLHVEKAYKLWDERNQYKWELDISLIIDNGFSIK